MDFDLNQFDAEIARYDGNSTAIGARQLSSKMANAIAALLPELSKDTPKAVLDKIAQLCQKTVEFSPEINRLMLQGQFYCAIEDFQRASQIFTHVYDIQKDEKEYPEWPHLQKNDYNLRLIAWWVQALYHSGKTDDAWALNNIRIKWEGPQASSREPQ